MMRLVTGQFHCSLTELAEKLEFVQHGAAHPVIRQGSSRLEDCDATNGTPVTASLQPGIQTDVAEDMLTGFDSCQLPEHILTDATDQFGHKVLKNVCTLKARKIITHD